MSIDYSNFAIPKPEKKVKEKCKYIKGHKHRQTKHTDISKKVKEAVWNRDNHKCIFCGKFVSIDYACCHYVGRAQGGLGIPENTFTACEDCHREQDNGLHSKEYTEIAENYLKSIYGPDWDKSKLIYKKY